MNDAERETPAAVAYDGRVEEGQQVTEPSVVLTKKPGPLTRTSVFIEDLIRDQIRSFARDQRCKESDVIRAALALGLHRLKRPHTATGEKEALIDDEIDRVENAVIDGDFELARKIVRRLQLDDTALTIKDRLTKSLQHGDYLTALHIIDRLAARVEVQ